MVQANHGDTVKVHYVGKLEDGTVFDSSYDREPLEFTIGQRQLIPGFEQGVIGMEPGESRTITITADQAYGPYRPEKVIDVDRRQLPEDMEPEVGMRLRGIEPSGRVIDFTIIGVTDSEVTLDGNHPLAGKNLSFDIELLEIS